MGVFTSRSAVELAQTLTDVGRHVVVHQAQFPRLADDWPRVVAGFVVLGRNRDDLLTHELLRHVDDLGLLVGQGKAGPQGGTLDGSGGSLGGQGAPQGGPDGRFDELGERERRGRLSDVREMIWNSLVGGNVTSEFTALIRLACGIYSPKYQSQIRLPGGGLK